MQPNSPFVILCVLCGFLLVGVGSGLIFLGSLSPGSMLSPKNANHEGHEGTRRRMRNATKQPFVILCVLCGFLLVGVGSGLIFLGSLSPGSMSGTCSY
jgi:hypothetical protein